MLYALPCTHFNTLLLRSRPNDNLKFPNLMIYITELIKDNARKEQEINVSFHTFTSTALLIPVPW